MGEQKTILISSENGILGESLTLHLAHCGYDIALFSTSYDYDFQSLKNKILSMGRKFFYYRKYTENPKEIEEIIDKAIVDLGHVNTLVCNDDDLSSTSLFSIDEKQLDRAYTHNYRNYLLQTKFVAHHMIKEKIKGSIILLTSFHGIRSYKNDLLQGSFSAAIHRTTESLALQLAPHNIRVNCLAKGFLSANSEEDNTMGNKIPLERCFSISDLGNAIEFLSSDKSNYITGTLLKLDGGFTLPGMPESNHQEAGYGWNQDYK